MEMIAILKEELGTVSDPRVVGRTQHQLLDILVLGVLAVICHAETWEEIEDFGCSRLEWLKKFLDLPNGIPSHDTIARVFSLIEPRELELAFIHWVERIRGGPLKGDTICLDGKSLHGTSNSTMGQSRSCLHLVSAWSTQEGLSLGQLKAHGKGNSEVSAVLDLLNLLDIKKMVLVGDAGVGKVSVMEKIIEKKGDYIFPLKSDSKSYFEEVQELVDQASLQKECETHITQDMGHGRVEKRQCFLVRKEAFPEGFNQDRKCKKGEEHFPRLEAIGKIIYERQLPETAPFTYQSGRRQITKDPIRFETETRYFVTSLKYDPEVIMEKLRSQWSIENQLHWRLDVSLGEDANKTRNKIAAENLATARKIALNLVKQDTSRRIGLKSRLKRAAWDLNYLETLLMNTKLQ